MSNYSPFVSHLIDKFNPSMGLFLSNINKFSNPFEWKVCKVGFLGYEVYSNNYRLTDYHSKKTCEEFVKYAQQTWVLFL